MIYGATEMRTVSIAIAKLFFWTPKAGIMGWLEKLSVPGIMRKLYATELKNVQEYLQKEEQGGGGGFA